MAYKRVGGRPLAPENRLEEPSRARFLKGADPMRLPCLLGAACAAFCLSATAAVPSSELATAVEFYHSGLDHYFVSTAPGEINDLDTGVHTGWARTGYRFAVVKAGSAYPATVPVCRFYSPTLDTHFYSAKVSECNDVKAKFAATWQFEADEVFRAFLVDPASGACPADTTPVYRLYNNRADANHRYTDQIALFLFMKGKGYIPEGDGSPALPVAFCTPAGGDAVPPILPTAPQCTLVSSDGAPAPGIGITLSATCTNGPTSYLWIGCTSTQSSCMATSATAGSATYTLYTANAQGPGAAAAITVNWTPAPPSGMPPNCSLAASPTFPAIGTADTLTATCSPDATSYQWLACDTSNSANCAAIASCAAASATCSVTSSVAGVARYIVSATNAYGTGPWTKVDVEWQNSVAFGGFCGQYARVKEFALPWGDPSRYTTAAYGGFTPETVIVMTMAVPGSPATYAAAGYTSLAEFNGPPAYRHMTLSTAPCDFRDPDPSGVNGPLAANAGVAVLINWNVGAAPVALVPGHTYYFNFRNLACGQDVCDAATSTTWPH